MDDRNAVIKGPYNQRSISARIEAFFLDNLAKVVTREQLIEVATDPKTGRVPENWHQRLSELRTDKGYTILSWRNRGDLRASEYMMPDAEQRSTASRRTRPNAATWNRVLEEHGYRCAWSEGGITCGLRKGDIDPVGGGTVCLTPDHKTPHALHAEIDPKDPTKWQPLCGPSPSHEEELLGRRDRLAERRRDRPVVVRGAKASSLRLPESLLWRH